jgi:hypothetical protein
MPRTTTKEASMRKLITGAVTGALVVGGALVASAQTDGSTTSTTAATAAVERGGRHGAVLQEALDGLVADGTLTQAQADAVTAAVEARAEAFRAEREAVREQMESFWEDGVLTADEIAQLPADHPLRDPDGPAAEYLEDGRLTEEELRSLHESAHPGGFGRHGRHGGMPGSGFGPGPRA